VIYGPVVGILAGLIGHTLIDLSWGSPWWSWIIASAIFGLIVGFASKKLDVDRGTFGTKEILTFNCFQIVGHLIAWVVVAPVLDILIYNEAANKVFAQGIFAAVSNAVTTAIIGTLLLIAYAKTRTKEGSLNKEN
jgi:energy-coupling factor transport system substrate-specific component